MRDILERGMTILDVLDGLSHDDFVSDVLRQKAVFYDFQCISEATARLLDMDPSLAERHVEIPWSQVRALGNVVRHVYGRLDIEVIWETAAGPRLRALMDVVRRELGE
jgi:uncharacterized protein with HEPN domain